MARVSCDSVCAKRSVCWLDRARTRRIGSMALGSGCGGRFPGLVKRRCTYGGVIVDIRVPRSQDADQPGVVNLARVFVCRADRLGPVFHWPLLVSRLTSTVGF